MSWFTSLFSSSNVSAGKAIQPDLVTRATLDRVVVHVTWVSDAEMAVMHPGFKGWTRGPDLLGDGEYHAWITAVQPKDFNDLNRTETLGHECWHALGAKHA